MKHMKRWMLFVAISAGLSGSVEAQSTDVITRANDLVVAGVQAFKAGNYGTALTKFEESYNLVPAATTAALACQAKVNADRDHPSSAVVWLSRWQSNAAKRPPDEKGWAAFQRAYEALGQITGDLEGQVAALKREKRTFDATYAIFDSQFKALSVEIDSTKHLLPAVDQARLDAQMKAIGMAYVPALGPAKL